jgi:anti-sigma regulatory factor (Ser/Thr protein kinase)
MRRAPLEDAAIEGAVAENMQRAVLPGLAEVPGFQLAARYLPADRAAIGGDWYDAIPLPDGRLCVVIGDVARRGPQGIARMARLQTLMRVHALDDARPEVVLQRANAHLFELSEDGMATVLCAVIDPENCIAEAATAGHPPPLHVDPDLEAGFWEMDPGPPLGVTQGATYEGRIGPVGEGETLLLFTNGLVSGPERPLAQGLEVLRRTGETGPGDPDALCERVVEALVGESPPRDDVAMLAVQIEPASDALSLSLPAKPASLATMRRALTRWMRRAGAEQHETYEAVVACGEACANAVAHAYPPVHDEAVEIQACRKGDDVEITVIDHGRWRGAEAREGKGLELMRELMDTVELDTKPSGTRVTMRRRLARSRS